MFSKSVREIDINEGIVVDGSLGVDVIAEFWTMSDTRIVERCRGAIKKHVVVGLGKFIDIVRNRSWSVRSVKGKHHGRSG